MDNPIVLLSAIVFLPVAGAFILLLPGLFDKDKPDGMRYFTLLVTAVVFALTVIAAVNFQRSGEAARHMQSVFNESWIPSFDIHYFMGIDGISFPLIILTSFISLLAMVASWNITKHVKAYCVLFLLLETGMLGVFMALDFFLFYVFWEVMLLPMYFLIGVWGGPRKEYAAIKFFLYTLVGSVLMLIAILMLYFTSDLGNLATEIGLYEAAPQAEQKWDRLNLRHTEQARIGRFQMYKSYESIVLNPPEGNRDSTAAVQLVPEEETETPEVICNALTKTVYVIVGKGETSAEEVVDAIHNDSDAAAMIDVSLASGADGTKPIMSEGPVHTFNLLALAAIGQHTKQFHTPLLFGWSLQIWAFVLLFIGFIIKVPSVPVHTWLPDAHVEAPTPISMILAGVLLKMGGYGIIRICYPICPIAGYELSILVCLIGVVSMIYGAFAAMAQKDFKRLVAYSSVSHMGYVVLGLGVWSAWAPTYNPDYWNMGVKGAMYQMIGHGISSAGMFFMVGVIYDRVHHRNLDQFGGLFGKMPVYTALAIGIFFAGLGLPGLCGFIGEVFVVLSVWEFSKFLAILSAAVVIITAAYILWTIQRVYLGSEYTGPHEDELKPITGRELAVAVPLFIFAIVLGVFPHTIPVANIPSVLAFMDPTIDRQVEELAAWTEEYDPPEVEIELELDVPDIGVPDIGVPEVSKISRLNRLRFVSRDANKREGDQEEEVREIDKLVDRREPVLVKHSKSAEP